MEAVDTYCQTGIRQTLLVVYPIATFVSVVYGTLILLRQYVKESGLLPQLPGPEIRLVKAKHKIPFPSMGAGLRVGN